MTWDPLYEDALPEFFERKACAGVSMADEPPKRDILDRLEAARMFGVSLTTADIEDAIREIRRLR